MSAPRTAPARRAPSRRRDWGRAAALVLCAIFAVVGAVPLALGILVRTEPVRVWAARETGALLAREIGVRARYDVRVQAWPMMIALDHVVVDAEDGGPPFLTAEQIAVRPRPFSLLGGKLDAGDVEIIGPRARVVVDHGELANLRVTLPKRAAPKKEEGPSRLPLTSLSITDARVDALVDGVKIAARALDVDVSVEESGALEVALRAGESHVTRVHPFVGREIEEDAVDDDVICRLDARVRVDGRQLFVRRLSLLGSADFDPDPDTAPACKLGESDWRAVELRVGSAHLDVPASPAPGAPPIRANGRVHARLPVPLVHRFAVLPHASGSVALDLEVDYDGLSRLPRLRGHVAADQPGIDGKLFSSHLDLDVATDGEAIRATKLVAHWGDGTITIPEVVVEPFKKNVPLTAGPVYIEGIEFHALLRDLGAHPTAHVGWTLEKGRFEHFKGTLNPPLLEGPLTIATRNFEIFDRPVIDKTHAHMMGIKEGTVRGTFVVNGLERSKDYKFPGIVLSNFSIDTPRSHLATTVTLGFASVLDIEVYDGSRIDLSEISPLVDIPLAGKLAVRASGRGPFTRPLISGDVAIKDFMFGGFPIGDLESGRVAFEPTVLDLFDGRVRHNGSRARAPFMRFAFDQGASVIIDGEVDTREAPGMRVRDLLEIFRLDKDPRWADIDGAASGRARVHYALGGREDRCGGGVLDVRASMGLADALLFGERYDEGSIDFDFRWDDQLAGTAGLSLDLHSATLRKGSGSVLASATVRHGGLLRGSVVGSGVPLARLDMLGGAGRLFDGTASMVVDLGGTLGALEAVADVNVSKIRIGPSSLGPSRLRVGIEPAPAARRTPGRTRCGNPRSPPFDPGELERDASDGLFRISGSLFDGQATLDDVRISRQRHKVLAGRLATRDLDLGTLANMIPGVAFASTPPRGSLTATLDVKSLPLDTPQRGDMTLTLDRLDLARGGMSVRLVQKSGNVVLRGDDLVVPDLRVEARTASGVSAVLVAGGRVRRAMTAPDLDVRVRVEPVDLGRISADIADVERASGTLSAELGIAGPPASLRFTGAARLRKGELALKGWPAGLEDVNLDVEIGGGEARIRKATAKVGGGTVELSGRVPLRGPDAGAATANVIARGVKLPVADGVNLTADAELEASYRPTPEGRGPRSLPDIKGVVQLTSFSYTRPIALSLSLSQLGRVQRTNVDAYDPANDAFRFNVTLVSPRPLRFSNNLVNMDLEVMAPGLVLSGTNQRFGARGLLRILPDSKLQLRSSEFSVREGYVRFDDPLKIAPKVDVRAQTEYRRYATSTSSDTRSTTDTSAPTGASNSPTSVAASTSQSGIWRIVLQANGDADNLKVKLTSDPPLSQEDIVLLLTIGMTRAEIDRGAASSLGETVGLEALSALTGADKAVKTIVPLIDEFRFGSGYSSRTGRTEPTVTLGKRITDDVRATVTTGVSENREIRSNLEWKLNRNLSVQGSYDNLNDVSNSPLGNVGADFRWRLEFE